MPPPPHAQPPQGGFVAVGAASALLTHPRPPPPSRLVVAPEPAPYNEEERAPARARADAPPPRGPTRLYTFAINYPARRDLATALTRLLDGGWGIDGASDHGTHEAIYLHDPDFNGIELAWDRSQDEWPRRDGAVAFGRKP